jgi:hypothetical protein
MATVTVSFTVDEQCDRDLMAWLEAQPVGRRSAAIRAAIRAQVSPSRVDLTDVYQAVVALDRKLARGVRLTGEDAGEEEETPPDVLATLDNLGL